MSRFGSGLDGEQMHAIFGLDYQETIWKQFRDRGRDTYCLVRSSGPLAAPYPFALYSDLYEHRQFVRGILTAGFSGLLWCPEVRDAVSQEDLIRRLQTAVFSPLAMVNAWYIRNPPWKQLNRELNNNGTLVENWRDLEAQCREIIGWRMRLIPYLLSAFHRYVYDGTPPFRALVLDHPEDAGVQTADDEYMIGDRMLVAPLFAGEAKRTIVLPAGEWHDFWTGKRIEGAQIEAAASTEKIPVFVRSGSIVPLAAVGASTASEESRKLTVQVYGDGHLGWQLNPAAPGDLQFTWNAPEQRGGVQLTSSGRPYQVIGWRQLGV
jgi:alpha-D-xyloside xylohydrolase